LKSSIEKEKCKNNITGETVEKGEFGSAAPPLAPLFYSVLEAKSVFRMKIF
jgi:hypothetical protein